MKIHNTIYFFMLSLLLSCDMQKNVDIVLPSYSSENMIECYLEPDKLIHLLSSQSVSYFDSIYPDVIDASIKISSTNFSDSLTYRSFVANNPYVDTFALKIYNYQGHKKTPNSQEIFNLLFEDVKGNKATASTYIPKLVSIDSSVTTLSTDKKKYNIKCLFTDIPEQKDFYRMVITVNGLGYNEKNIDFVFNDNNLLTSKGAIITSYRFEVGDTLYPTLYHLTEDHYKFINSVKDADNANGNPFAQPSSIKSNISGAIGIFTGISYDRDTIIITSKP